MDEKQKIRNLIDTVAGFHGGYVSQELYDVLKDTGVSHQELEEAGLDLQKFYSYDYDSLMEFNHQFQQTVNGLFAMAREGFQNGDADIEVDMTNYFAFSKIPFNSNPYLQDILIQAVNERAEMEDMAIEWDEDLCRLYPPGHAPKQRPAFTI